MVYNKQISVIVPTLGRLESLSSCIKSLLNQSLSPSEIIIVDNSQSGNINNSLNSLINRLPLINKIKIRCIRENRQGSAFARNRGLRKANYDLVAFIDDDCEASNNWIEQIINASKLHPDSIIQGKNLNGLPNNLFACVEHFTTESFLRSFNFLDTKNFAFSKSILRKTDLFDSRFSYIYEDVDFGLRLKERGIKIIYESKILVKHFGRTNLIDHYKREFHKGGDFPLFQSKWLREEYVNKEIERVFYKYIEKKFRKNIPKNRNWLFYFSFQLILTSDKFFFWCGYFYKNLRTRFT